MDTAAIVMLILGALALWGGLALAILNYARVSRRDNAD